MAQLTKGLKVRNTETLKEGIIIDWGLNRVKFRDYIPLPSYDKHAEAVRVRTDNSIEVWLIHHLE